MNNRQMMAVMLVVIIAVGVGMTVFWLGARYGNKQTRDDFSMANGLLLAPYMAASPSEEPVDQMNKRQIGFRRCDEA